MKKKFYLPSREGDRVTWLNNFSVKLPGYAATFNIAAGDVTAVQAMALIYAYIIGLIELSETYTQDLTKFKNRLSIAPSGTTLGPLPTLTPGAAPPLTAAGIFTFIGGIVAGIKSKKSVYTDAIGEDLGIIGDETSFDEVNYTPVLKGKVMPGSVTVSFNKEGVEGQAIYSHPVGGTDPNVWEKLGNDFHSPYHDTRPLKVPGTPELRDYKSRGIINDVEIGQWSAVITVTFSG